MLSGKLIIKTNNPYDWNTIVAKRMEKNKDTRTPSMAETMLDKEFMLVGKFLGLDGKPDFQKYQDKLREIITWGIERVQSHDTSTIIDALKEKLNASPSMNARRIDDLWVAVKLEQLKQEPKDFNGNFKTEEVK